jgi:endonuclease/exonuclease/phosphatase family metal-dependent hydrolase
MDGRHDPDRVAAVIRELDADLIGLQEVDSRRGSEGGIDQLEYLARASGCSYVAGPTLRRHDGESGNGLLTRHPIRSHRLFDLSVHGREPRGAIDVELEHAGVVVRVVVTHLGLRARERREQGGRLLQLLAARGEQVAVLLGDFNEWGLSSRLLRRLHRNFGPGRSVRTFPAPLPLLPLDRIWARPHAAVVELAAHRSRLARRASDHLPVRAVLDVACGAGEPEPD